MEGITICYDFNFTLVVKKRNGRTFHRHLAAGIGLDFSAALWEVYFQTQKKEERNSENYQCGTLADCFCFSWRGIAKTQNGGFPANGSRRPGNGA